MLSLSEYLHVRFLRFNLMKLCVAADQRLAAPSVGVGVCLMRCMMTETGPRCDSQRVHKKPLAVSNSNVCHEV